MGAITEREKFLKPETEKIKGRGRKENNAVKRGKNDDYEEHVNENDKSKGKRKVCC